MKQVLIVLARGYEDLEAASFAEVIGWSAHHVPQPPLRFVTAGFHPAVRSHLGISQAPDLFVSEASSLVWDALVIPGGFHQDGWDEIFSPVLGLLCQEVYARGGWLAGCGSGGLVLAEAGLLSGCRATTYARNRRDHVAQLRRCRARYVNAPVVEDGRVITCRDPAAALSGALLLLDRLCGQEAAERVRSQLGVPRENHSRRP